MSEIKGLRIIETKYDRSRDSIDINEVRIRHRRPVPLDVEIL